ncbi:hypothetical protein DLAC_03646 [Tieghemostelium lacteum]|uniref:Uncharacterized protein n=1 Tax=Tieghemostelium lacteum TaxID=361077 RepID=A0A152A0R4_TIELA|nr:hypothetical protein DLAC_03646 [Tieghemostelium lacteum]|eukprot:KYQ99706.1 hypothetical protein DLAC_03646 [Tieghemostelium lacteum]
MKSLPFFVILGALSFITNPVDREIFKAQLYNHVQTKSGFIAGMIAKGAVSLNAFTIKNYYLFSLAFLNDFGAENNQQLVAVGYMGKWFFVKSDI